MCRKDEPFYYDSLKCCECSSRNDLHGNRYSDRIMCLSCLNQKLKQSETKTIQIDVIEVELEE